MILIHLIAQLRYCWKNNLLRITTICIALLMMLVAMLISEGQPDVFVDMTIWTFFLTSLVVGGCISGWRISQIPKTRALELQFVTPVPDSNWILSEVIGGCVRSLFMCSATAPLWMILVGLEWIQPLHAVAVISTSVAVGWASGLSLAVVAYESNTMRRLGERLVFVLILLYLIGFGLLGSEVLPRAHRLWVELRTLPSISRIVDGVHQCNPLSVISDVARSDRLVLENWILSTLLLFIAICTATVRLIRRLRPHYDEEQFGENRIRRRSRFRIGMHPLSWWTARRVSRFRGRVNLYLFVSVTGLYCGWILWNTNWPQWLAVRQLMIIDQLGGGAMLTVVAAHLAIVPAAFLNGLWDSSVSDRSRRMELLLLTDLRVFDYLHASIKAAWLRGRGYIVSASLVWGVSVWTGILVGTRIGIQPMVITSYVMFTFSIAFASFNRIASDHVMAVTGLVLSVAAPLASLLLYHWSPALAALTPLGLIYLSGLSDPALFAATRLGPEQFTVCAMLYSLIYTLLSALLMIRTIRGFDHNLHLWYSRQFDTNPGKRVSIQQTVLASS